MLSAHHGDITAQDVDAIVNAANSSLLGGGGVDGAIHAAAGPDLLAECRRLRDTALPDGLGVGEAVVTGAGNLAARWVIHTVGPNRHRGQRDPDLLAACFTNSLRQAAGVGATSVAFPAISAGVYGWDPEQVARVGVSAVRAFLADDDAITQVRFVLFSRDVLGHFEAALAGGST
ncbi:O-acetyl-ADP-ribose deacetylase [Pseudactinotalea sp. Z1732]|uniref:O-acetyl-ADP-ribose deacetylase n=1 Tax=Micrococcales TaxID=85006 RepID=UPI003C7D9721